MVSLASRRSAGIEASRTVPTAMAYVVETPLEEVVRLDPQILLIRSVPRGRVHVTNTHSPQLRREAAIPTTTCSQV